MMIIMISKLLVFIAILSYLNVNVVLCQEGPGRGPWIVLPPESQGLSSEGLQQAADEVYDGIPNRGCFLVVKNGYIVHESYWNGWHVNHSSSGASTTKSHCSSLFGIARQQGWANVSDYIRDRNSNTRECNPEARFQNVLLMNGEGDDMNDPSFWYDGNGESCLDTLSDFIRENNPEGLSTEEFAKKYWSGPLGMENFIWESDETGHLGCGYQSSPTCRDLARAGQLWLNEGVWDGQQIIQRDHILEGRVYPTYSNFIPYGYNIWLDCTFGRDPIDDGYHGFVGANDQLVWISPRHNALVVSMGTDASFGILSYRAWYAAREHIVSNEE